MSSGALLLSLFRSLHGIALFGFAAKSRAVATTHYVADKSDYESRKMDDYRVGSFFRIQNENQTTLNCNVTSRSRLDRTK